MVPTRFFALKVKAKRSNVLGAKFYSDQVLSVSFQRLLRFLFGIGRVQLRL
jgi:hypothetical protein